MLTVHCPRHGREVLLGHRQIVGIEGHGPDLAVRWVCWCGHHGTFRPRPVERRPVEPAAVERAA